MGQHRAMLPVALAVLCGCVLPGLAVQADLESIRAELGAERAELERAQTRVRADSAGSLELQADHSASLEMEADLAAERTEREFRRAELDAERAGTRIRADSTGSLEMFEEAQAETF